MKTPAGLAGRTFLLLAMAFCLVAQGEEQIARRPIVMKGDTWHFKILSDSMLANREESVEEFTVTFANDKTIVGTSVRTVGKLQTEEDWTWTAELNPLSSTTVGMARDSSKVLYAPNKTILKFPLRVGDKYASAYEVTTANAHSARQSFKMERTYKVVGWRSVTVPAGTFMTLLIESEGHSQELVSRRWIPTTESYWYSPEVRHWVKYINRTIVAVWESELIYYKLSEE